MKYWNEQTRDALASEYVLGTLQGRARRRFEQVLRYDPALRAQVERWEERLLPLGDAIQPVTPPRQVWQYIEARIQGRVRPHGLWQSLSFWRVLSACSMACAIAFAAFLTVWTPTDGKVNETMVVVMSDQQARPMITVSWPMHENNGGKLRVRVIGHQEMSPETAWELWMLPDGNGKPQSLGLITTHENQEVEIPKNMMPVINAAWGMAMSVEPRGGSPIGAPTGPMLYKGPCTRI